MTFGEAISKCLGHYADFNGRATRSEYWWFVLFSILVQLGGSIVGNMIAALLALALLVPSVAVAARRLHDIGKSGWLLLLWIIPLIGWLIVLYWHVQPSAEGKNEYGEAPAAS